MMVRIVCCRIVALTIHNESFFFLLDLIFRYIDDTPFVRGRVVTFSLEFGRTVTGASCAVKDGSQNALNCKLNNRAC